MSEKSVRPDWWPCRCKKPLLSLAVAWSWTTSGGVSSRAALSEAPIVSSQSIASYSSLRCSWLSAGTWSFLSGEPQSHPSHVFCCTPDAAACVASATPSAACTSGPRSASSRRSSRRASDRKKRISRYSRHCSSMRRCSASSGDMVDGHTLGIGCAGASPTTILNKRMYSRRMSRRSAMCFHVHTRRRWCTSLTIALIAKSSRARARFASRSSGAGRSERYCDCRPYSVNRFTMDSPSRYCSSSRITPIWSNTSCASILGASLVALGRITSFPTPETGFKMY